jgi:hypothetical protein
MTCIKTLQKIAKSPYILAGIESNQPFRIRELFQRFSIATGCGVYESTEEGCGLRRIGFEHISIPKTRTPEEMLNYILSARHYGIYLFTDFSSHLASETLHQLIHQIKAKEDGVRRLIVLLEEEITIPPKLAPLMLKVQHRTKPMIQQSAPYLPANVALNV